MRDLIGMAATMALTMTIAAAPPKPAAKAAPAAAATPSPVTRTLFITQTEADFRKLDTDKNGSVTKKEAEDYQLGIIRGQLEEKRRALFAALDADHNGMVSPQEFTRLPLNMPQVDASPLMNTADSNHDGQVTLAEYRASKLVSFDKLDTDRNGIVTPAEMKAGGLIK